MAPPRVLAPGGWRRALAEGIAVTVSATLATAPLIAYVFEEISADEPRRQRPRPARGGARDVARDGLGGSRPDPRHPPGAPERPRRPPPRLHRPGRRLVRSPVLGRPPRPHRPPRDARDLRRDGRAPSPSAPTWPAPAAWRPPAPRSAPSALVVGAVDLTTTHAGPRSAVDLSGAIGGQGRPHDAIGRKGRPRRVRGRRLAVALVGLRRCLASVRSRSGSRGRRALAGPPPGLRIEVLDVGQGDAILLQPRSAPAVLVDGGPPGDELVAKLHDEGVDRSAPRSSPTTSPITRPGSRKRSGGCRSRGSSTGASTADSSRTPAPHGARPDQVAAGTTLRSGSLHLEVIWPPPTLLAEDPPDTDPNAARPGDPGALAPLHDAAHRRRGGRIDAARPGPDRRAEGRPPRLRRRRASGRCSIASVPGSR